jgi:hypothetical protein
MLKYILKVQECDATIAETCTAAGYTKIFLHCFLFIKKTIVAKANRFFQSVKIMVLS